MILYLRNVLDMKMFLSSVWHTCLFILHPIFISARSFLFPLSFHLCVLYIKHCSVLEQRDLKYGIVSLTSFIPRIAVVLLLQFVFVITNNKYRIKCCSRNEIFYPLLHHHFKIRYNIDWSIYHDINFGYIQIWLNKIHL